jgi:hypothetical protein
MLWIWDVYPGSRIRIFFSSPFRIPDPQKGGKNKLAFLTAPFLVENYQVFLKKGTEKDLRQ